MALKKQKLAEVAVPEFQDRDYIVTFKCGTAVHNQGSVLAQGFPYPMDEVASIVPLMPDAAPAVDAA